MAAGALVVVGAAVVGGGLVVAGAASAAGIGSISDATVAEISRQSLTALEIDNLMYMREKEKLARDVYLSMFDAWGLAVFSLVMILVGQFDGMAGVLAGLGRDLGGGDRARRRRGRQAEKDSGQRLHLAADAP